MSDTKKPEKVEEKQQERLAEGEQVYYVNEGGSVLSIIDKVKKNNVIDLYFYDGRFYEDKPIFKDVPYSQRSKNGTWHWLEDEK